MIVTDASVILERLLKTRIAPTLERRLFGERETLHAPALLDVEVAQVLRRYARNTRSLAHMAAPPCGSWLVSR